MSVDVTVMNGSLAYSTGGVDAVVESDVKCVTD